MRRCAALPVLFCALLACACGPAAPSPDQEVTFEDERAIDLTGDGQLERVLVAASGPSYGALRVQLDVLTAGDSLLFRERWFSADYFESMPYDERADTTVQRIVRGYLTELLRDTAFAPPVIVAGERQPDGMTPDPEAVRYDIAEFSWRRSAGIPDTVPLPHGAHEQIQSLMISESDVAGLVTELARQPSFSYRVSGELVWTIAWSPQERRFIRMRAAADRATRRTS